MIINASIYNIGTDQHSTNIDGRSSTIGMDYAAEYGNNFTSDSVGDGEPSKKKSRKESIFDIDFHRIVLDEAVSGI